MENVNVIIFIYGEGESGFMGNIMVGRLFVCYAGVLVFRIYDLEVVLLGVLV